MGWPNQILGTLKRRGQPRFGQEIASVKQRSSSPRCLPFTSATMAVHLSVEKTESEGHLLPIFCKILEAATAPRRPNLPSLRSAISFVVSQQPRLAAPQHLHEPAPSSPPLTMGENGSDNFRPDRFRIWSDRIWDEKIISGRGTGYLIQIRYQIR